MQAVAQQHRHISEREQEGEGGYRPDFQRQPCVEWQEGAQRFIEERHEGEKERPVTRQLQPALVRKAVVGCLQQLLEQWLFLSQPPEKTQSTQGVYNSGLDLDDQLIEIGRASIWGIVWPYV